MNQLNTFKLILFLSVGLLIGLVRCNSTANTAVTDRGSNRETSVTPPTLAEKLKAYGEQLEQGGFAGAILVAQNDEIIWEAGYGLANETANIPNTAQTIFDTGSLSKQFTAAAILHLAEQGLLQVEDTLAKHFEDVPADKAEITIHQLLTHSSGLQGYVYEGDFIETNRQQAQSLIFASSLETTPGTEYLYSDTGYGLLAIIVEIVSGQPFQSYLKEHLFEPAGMIHTGFYNDPQWQEQPVAHGYYNGEDVGSAATRPGPYWGLLGFGGVLTTVGDLYLWNQALSSDLILSEAARTQLFTPYIREYEGEESFYGYGWVIINIPEYGQLIWHDGANDSQNAIFVRADDANNTLVVILSNRIDETLFSETFYATDTGFILVQNILDNDFSNLPDYVK